MGEARQTRLAWRRTLTGAGLAMLVSVPVSVFVIVSVVKNPVDALGSLTLVVGSWVPTSLELLSILASVGTATLLVGSLWAPPPDPRWPYPLRLALAIGLVIIIPFSLLALAVLGPRGYRILPGESEGGCRVVLQTDWFGGTVGVVQPGSSTLGWVSEFFADDGDDPFRNGTSSLAWNGTKGVLAISATTANTAGWSDTPPTLRCRA